jgi:hypothetical protein
MCRGSIAGFAEGTKRFVGEKVVKQERPLTLGSLSYVRLLSAPRLRREVSRTLKPRGAHVEASAELELGDPRLEEFPLQMSTAAPFLITYRR